MIVSDISIFQNKHCSPFFLEKNYNPNMLILPREKIPEHQQKTGKNRALSDYNDIILNTDINKYVYDTETKDILFYEPIPMIGMLAKCTIKNVGISQLDLLITHLNDQNLGINHKAIYKLSFITQDESARFLVDEYIKLDIFSGIIDGFCDQKGILIRKR